MQYKYKIKGADGTDVELGFDSGGFFFARVWLAETGQVLCETKSGKGLASLAELEHFLLPWVDLKEAIREQLREVRQRWEEGQEGPFELLVQPYQWGRQELRFYSKAPLNLRKLTNMLAYSQTDAQQPWSPSSTSLERFRQRLHHYAVARSPRWKRAKDMREYLGFVQQLVHFYQDQSTGVGHHEQWWRAAYLQELYEKEDSPINKPVEDFGEAEQVFLHLEKEELSAPRQQQLNALWKELGWEPLNWALPELLDLEAKASSLLAVLNQKLHPQQRDLLSEQMNWLHPLRGEEAEQQVFKNLLPALAEEKEQAFLLEVEAEVWPQRELWKRYCLLLIALCDWAMAYPAPNHLNKIAKEQASRLAYDPWIKFWRLYQGFLRLKPQVLESFWAALGKGKAAKAEQILLRESRFPNAQQRLQFYASSEKIYTEWERFLKKASSQRFDSQLIALRQSSATDRLKRPQRYIGKLQLLGCCWTNLTFSQLEYQGFIDNLLHGGLAAEESDLLEWRREALLYDSLEQLALRAYGDAAPFHCPFSDERFKCHCRGDSCKMLRKLRQLPDEAQCLLSKALRQSA